MSKRAETISKELEKLYPETHCFLNYKKDYELLFAVILSAQATDESVNKATETMYEKVCSLKEYVSLGAEGIYPYISKVGLAKSKSKYLYETAKILLEKYDGKVVEDREKLMELPGVGYKTSGVVLAELYNYPLIPVDTHIFRVTKRLSLLEGEPDNKKAELILEKKFGKDRGVELHRRLILFGRNICQARKPKCEICPFFFFCKNKIS